MIYYGFAVLVLVLFPLIVAIFGTIRARLTGKGRGFWNGNRYV